MVAWAATVFGARLAVTSSMTDAVVPHLTAAARPGVDVLFLDTGYHFAETIATRDAVAALLPVTVIDVRPAQTVAEQDAVARTGAVRPRPGPVLRAAQGGAAGRRARAVRGLGDRCAAGGRAGRRRTKIVEWDLRRQMVKINPIVGVERRGRRRLRRRARPAGQPAGRPGLPVDRLRPVHAAAAAGRGRGRAGRWAGTDKTECGLHL